MTGVGSTARRSGGNRVDGRGGRRARAERQSRSDDAHARSHTCVSVCMIWTISPIACCGFSPARSRRLRVAIFRPNAIVVARNMGPAELLDYDRAKIRGVILEEGGRNGHVAIVARALGIPALGQAEGLIDVIDTGSPLIVDGGTAATSMCGRRLTSSALISKKCGSMPAGRRNMRHCAIRRLSRAMASRIQLQINAGLLVDLPHLAGIGCRWHRALSY